PRLQPAERARPADRPKSPDLLQCVSYLSFTEYSDEDAAHRDRAPSWRTRFPQNGSLFLALSPCLRVLASITYFELRSLLLLRWRSRRLRRRSARLLRPRMFSRTHRGAT